ncbi:MAG: hypothetical protein KAS30_05260 [Candidatus Diapherotrites archaeon]|nr:hypothetical protein [Candidatus Diapherotrites archaeon]
MKDSLKTGFYFGLTSGIITTLGLIVGLHAGTNSQIIVIGGIITIAIADAFSDSLGIHISEEAKNGNSNPREIWEATISTFLSKFLFTLTFLIPMIVFPLEFAITASIAWGLFVLGTCSFYIATRQKTNPWHVTGEHLFIALVVITLTHFVGDYISQIFI